VLLAAFGLIERRSRAPMVPSRVVRDRNRGGANAVTLLLGAGMLAMFYLLTLYMQVVQGYSATRTGLAYLPFVAGVGVASGGRHPTGRCGARRRGTRCRPAPRPRAGAAAAVRPAA